MLDALDGEQQFAGMQLPPSAELTAIIGQHRADLDAEFGMKRQDPLVEQTAGGDRQLRGLDLGEGRRADGAHRHLDRLASD